MSMARDMRKFISVFGSVISQSIPHIYLSALGFSPRNSAIWREYGKDYPGAVNIESGGLNSWPAMQNVLSGHQSWVSSVGFSPDGKRIVSGSEDKTVRVWDAETGEVVLGPLQEHSGSVWSVAFSPDGKRIFSGSEDETVRVWDAETGEVVLGPLEGHSNSIWSVAFSPD